ncbi:MAG TPA: MATE family efflux transporter [Armatimonadota bacterium]|jgi:putative MATE family efflux protein
MTEAQTDSQETPRQEHGRDLTQGSIPRLLLAFCWPLLLGNMIQAGYSIVNRFWVGQYLGADALAAITVTMQVSFILIAIANGITLGSSILVSQFVGACNWDGVRRVVQSAVVVIGALSIILLILGQFLAVPLLKAVNTPEHAFPLAISYMRLFLCSFPLVFMAILTTFLLRGVGDSLTPLIFQGAGVILTAILDPLLMLGWFGFPKLGLNGTAVAMLIAQTIGIVTFFIYLQRKNHVVAPDWGHLRVDRAISKMILVIGLPSAAQQLLVSVGSAGILFIVNGFHENATAAFGAASQIDMLAFFVAMSFSMAISSLAGQNIGAGRYERIREIFWWGLLLSGGITLVCSGLAVHYAHVVMRIFIQPQMHPEAFRIGVEYLHIVGFSYVIIAVMFVCLGITNGAGHTFVAALMTLLGLWVVRLPLAAFLSYRLHSVTGIWYAMVISFTVSMLFSLWYYFSGRWKRTVINHGPATPLVDEAVA